VSAPIRIALRAGERIYINGAVLRADRKISFEILNSASFLLETHILQAEDATTPLRQLYFALQTLLIEPASSTARNAFATMFMATLGSFSTTDVVVGLKLVGRLVEGERIFEALKTLRGLFAVEAAILNSRVLAQPQGAAEEHGDGREQHESNPQRDGHRFFRERRRKYG